MYECSFRNDFNPLCFLDGKKGTHFNDIATSNGLNQSWISATALSTLSMLSCTKIRNSKFAIAQCITPNTYLPFHVFFCKPIISFYASIFWSFGQFFVQSLSTLFYCLYLSTNIGAKAFWGQIYIVRHWHFTKNYIV